MSFNENNFQKKYKRAVLHLDELYSLVNQILDRKINQLSREKLTELIKIKNELYDMRNIDFLYYKYHYEEINQKLQNFEKILLSFVFAEMPDKPVKDKDQKIEDSDSEIEEIHIPIKKISPSIKEKIIKKQDFKKEKEIEQAKKDLADFIKQEYIPFLNISLDLNTERIIRLGENLKIKVQEFFQREAIDESDVDYLESLIDKKIKKMVSFIEYFNKNAMSLLVASMTKKFSLKKPKCTATVTFFLPEKWENKQISFDEGTLGYLIFNEIKENVFLIPEKYIPFLSQQSKEVDFIDEILENIQVSTFAIFNRLNLEFGDELVKYWNREIYEDLKHL